MVSTVGTIIWFTWASLGIAGALSTSSFQEIQEQTNTLLGYKEKITMFTVVFSIERNLQSVSCNKNIPVPTNSIYIYYTKIS